MESNHILTHPPPKSGKNGIILHFFAKSGLISIFKYWETLGDKFKFSKLLIFAWTHHFLNWQPMM